MICCFFFSFLTYLKISLIQNNIIIHLKFLTVTKLVSYLINQLNLIIMLLQIVIF